MVNKILLQFRLYYVSLFLFFYQSFMINPPYLPTYSDIGWRQNLINTTLNVKQPNIYCLLDAAKSGNRIVFLSSQFPPGTTIKSNYIDSYLLLTIVNTANPISITSSTYLNFANLVSIANANGLIYFKSAKIINALNPILVFFDTSIYNKILMTDQCFTQ